MNAARRKVASEGRCRNCGSRDQLEAAHTIPRSLGGKLGADSILPLCAYCHRAQHDHRLELLPLMNRDEQVEAVRAIGIARAYRYLTRES
jgi:5-methylcytosine-specific restriction endonuclease McrA